MQEKNTGDRRGATKLEPYSLLERYQISDDDLLRVKRHGDSLSSEVIEAGVAHFYDWLRKQSEFDRFFGGDPEKLDRVMKAQSDYWARLFRGEVDSRYIESRLEIGGVHARIGLPLPVYFSAMNRCLEIFTENLLDHLPEPSEFFSTLRAVTKLVHMDTAIVVDRFYYLTNKTISDQSRTLMEMSTPVTAIWDGVLLLPLVGIIDSKRANDMMNSMLERIAETQSRVIILDISGVGLVDTAVANHLIKITKATELMGCTCMISGISPAIAQTIVELGIDVGKVKTTATLRDALLEAFAAVGAKLSD